MVSSGFDLLIVSLPQLGKGLLQTLTLALYCIVCSTVGGLVFGVLRASRRRWLGVLTRTYLELFRSIPILVWLFFFFFGLPIFFGIDLPGFACAVLVLSLWGMTEVGEAVRGALISLPRGQKEAGQSIGLSPVQLYVHVLLPQALRRMIPPVINVYTRIVKTTSLAVLIGVTEIIKTGQQMIERTGESVLIYGTLFLLYFALCYPLSVLSRRLENKLRSGGEAGVRDFA
ncbi:amino acid ABC transporter permease [Paenibacillus elgii]|uniref:Amino acid ABC transporter permease n=1 Tax=Paenibacillus elgii TaxID=189691 RepID=A0A163ZP81_9BACL|nr:amino acid ABC transporter permease [Paenibacillus elgii]KZE82177.1 amino acid ABC transporter permease [Paenibacillus elgii]NEN81616.1 amino acid ABC transporter permease [Paenibacillus elgii]